MNMKKKTRKTKPDNPTAKGNSRYAKKKAYLRKHGGFGFDYPNKPWKN